MSPLYFCRVSLSRHVALGDFLGALDDEEFFVVEGLEGGVVAGSLDSQVTRHQLVSVTRCIEGLEGGGVAGSLDSQVTN